ncbi:hypothetical protein [uncultured Modestobacter sp.]|uniref:hypothetical protein n=1 Tax=uncultured Modestobacter sp. TaxID=380048 RepID=UPI0026363E04|nr:hypothetical protein [uncultured Modestobacter sp.]
MDPTSAESRRLVSGEESRWAAAMSVLDRAPNRSARERLRRRRLLSWSWVLGLVVVLAAGATLLALLFTDALVPEPGPSSGWVVTGLVVQGAGIVLLVGFAVIAWRAGLFRWSQPTAVLDRAQRRRLLAQVRGRAAVDPARLPLARDLAERLVLQRHQVLFVAGILVQQLGRAISGPTTFVLLLTGGLSVVFAVALVLLRRDAQRAEAFLAEHPGQGGAGPG